MVLLVAWAFFANAETVNEESRSGSYNNNFVVAYYVPYVKEWFDPCSCVSYAKYLTGTSQIESWGNAWQIKPTTDDPYVGGLVLTNEGRGHLAYIQGIKGDTLYLLEANFISCETSTRELSISDTQIKGFR